MILSKIFKKGRKTSPFSTESYWENRYKSGGNSGSGSYGELSRYKAEYLNRFVSEKEITKVIDFGCGDGNQLMMASYDNYIGLDVSIEAIQICLKKFSTDPSKSFFLYHSKCFKDSNNVFSSDLTISMEVLFHLIEQDVYEKYLVDLFGASNKYVIIFSSNSNEVHVDDKNNKVTHVKHRVFTDYVKKLGLNFDLVHIEKNPLKELSFSDFYVFKKIE